LDERTIQAARAGDRTALASLLRELQDPWYRFSLTLLGGDVDTAREATQETGLRFLKALPAFRGDSQLQTWSLGIALNVAREMRRKSRPLPDGAGDHMTATRPAMPRPDDAADIAEQRDALRSVLVDLPDRQREAIVLRFFEEMSVEDTAAAMGCAQGTVKATVHQALRSLKQRLSSMPLARPRPRRRSAEPFSPACSASL